MKIPLASLGLRPNDIAAAVSVLESNKLTMGSHVKQFEENMARYLKVAHFIMVNSGSSANLAIIEALLRPSEGVPNLNEGDGVLVPAVAWPTTVWPLIQLGLKPHFIDINIQNLAIDLSKAQLAVDKNKSIKAIFSIHPLGYAIDHEELNNFCTNNSLIQINDVCESLGSWRNEKHAGTCGIASSYSFYFSHHITTMEGGGIATNDLNFANDIRAIRSHGWSRDRTDAVKWTETKNNKTLIQPISKNQSKFQFITTGYNIRPMEVQAAIGIEQLKDLDSFINRRRLIANSVKTSLQDTILEVIDGGALRNGESEKFHSWMLIPIRINKKITNSQRELLDSLLDEFGIESRPVLTGNFLRQPAMLKFKNMPNPIDFPESEFVSSNCFMVGSHHDLTDSQISYMCESLKIIASKL